MGVARSPPYDRRDGGVITILDEMIRLGEP